MTHKIVLVGGVPGSGKTYIGKELAKKIGIFIDKDTVSRFYTEQLLVLLGSHKDDREGEIYLNNVRSIEYETMLKLAFENIEIGNNVVCSAPFMLEFNDAKWVEDIDFEAELLDGRDYYKNLGSYG